MRRAAGILALVLLASSCATERSGEVFVGSASSFAHVIVSARDAYDEYRLKVLVVGSQTLVTQVLDDAPLDIVITADLSTMDSIVAAGKTAAKPRLLAGNRLAIGVERGNPLGISSLSDLARSDIKVVLAAPEVPLGAYSAHVLAAAELAVSPVSFTTNANAVAGLISSGEADAGLIYQTDLDVWRLDGVPLAAELNIVAEYYVAPIAGAPNPEGAAGFIEFLLEARGRALLADLGFST